MQAISFLCVCLLGAISFFWAFWHISNTDNGCLYQIGVMIAWVVVFILLIAAVSGMG